MELVHLSNFRYEKTKVCICGIKVSKSGKQFIVSSILPKNEQNSLSWVEKMLRIVSFVRFLGESGWR